METIELHLTPPPRQWRAEPGTLALDRVRLEMAGLTAAQLDLARRALQDAGLRLDPSAAYVLRLERQAQPPPALDAAVAEEFYELDLSPAAGRLGAVAWPGLWWGVQTLAQLVGQARRGQRWGRLHIRDWPALPHRGIFVENKWGPDRMEVDDWCRTVDRLAALKLNRLGIGLYGCWGSCRYEPGPSGRGWPTEFLMVPVPGHPELRSPKRLRWFSPQRGAWQDETCLPRLFAGDFLGQVVEYARERGVTVIPFVNSLGHNTLIPRLVPQISARDDQGRPVGMGYCLSSPQTRAFLEEFYASIVARYFGGHAPFFHVQLDEVWADHPDPAEPLRRAEPWCQCEQCRSRDREELLREYVLWLAEMLTRHGVDQVVMWNDQLTRHMDALDESFVARLRARGLERRLVFHWWWYSNEELHERTRVAIGQRLGLRGWVAPMTCYFNWQMYSPRLANIELMLRMAHAEGGEGAVAYAVHDPGWTDHEALLAAYAWSGAELPAWEQRVAAWARGHLGTAADRYLAAAEQLRTAASLPALARCYPYTYSYVRPGSPFPRAYPEEALVALGALPEAAVQLERAAALASAAAAQFAALAREPGADGALLDSLRGEAARIVGLGQAFGFLVRLRAAAAPVSEAQADECARVREALLAAMAQVELGKPHWVAPASLMALSILLAFLDQLAAEIRRQVRPGADAAGPPPTAVQLHWSLAQPYAQEATHAG